MKWTHGLALAALVVAGALGVRWRISDAAPPPVPPAPAADAAAAPTASPSPAPATAGSRPALPATEAPTPRVDPRTHPELADRMRQHELAPAADARWQQAVDGAGYRAEDLDASVRELFRRLDLEPRYVEDGQIEGLVITGMAPDHPLARLGFRPGDRIDRIQGVALRDPADIPSLLARLGPNFAVCVDRQGAELCGEVQLE